MGVGRQCCQLALQQLLARLPLLAYPRPPGSSLVLILIFAFSRCSLPTLLVVSTIVVVEVIADRAGGADSPIRLDGVTIHRSF